jgi:hypothetical protein
LEGAECAHLVAYRALLRAKCAHLVAVTEFGLSAVF